MSLSQAAKSGMIESTVKSSVAEVLDKRTGESVPMEEAIRKQLVDTRTPAVYDASSGRRVSIDQAIRTGKWLTLKRM